MSIVYKLSVYNHGGIMQANNRKTREKLNRKSDILDAAERIFFKKGFENSTMDDIALAAEFTKKTLYSYFKSKEDIYYEIMLRGYKILNRISRNMLDEEKSNSEIYNIKTLGKAFITFSVKYKGYFKAIVDYENEYYSSNVSDELNKECYKEGEYTFNILKESIENGIKKGEIIDRFSSLDVSLTLWSCILGFVNLIDKKEEYINKAYGRTASAVLENGFEIILNSIKKE